jgi:hypothetical protein
MEHCPVCDWDVTLLLPAFKAHLRAIADDHQNVAAMWTLVRIDDAAMNHENITRFLTVLRAPLGAAATVHVRPRQFGAQRNPAGI